MWTPTSRAQHSRTGLRYGSDLTDAEWTILEPFLPPPCCCGRRRKWPMRRIVEAIFYVLRGGIGWEMLPDGFPPHSTVYRWFARFRDDGIWETINRHLVSLKRYTAWAHFDLEGYATDLDEDSDELLSQIAERMRLGSQFRHAVAHPHR